MRAEDVKEILENWMPFVKMAGVLSEDAGAQAELEDMVLQTSVDYSSFDYFDIDLFD